MEVAFQTLKVAYQSTFVFEAYSQAIVGVI